MSLEYEVRSMKKTFERRLMWLEVTLIKMNVTLQSLERQVKEFGDIAHSKEKEP